MATHSIKHYILKKKDLVVSRKTIFVKDCSVKISSVEATELSIYNNKRLFF